MSTEELPSYQDVPQNQGAPPPGYSGSGYSPDLAAEEARPVISGSEPPPSYDSLFGRIKEARTEHGNSFGFLKALMSIVGAAIGGIVCIACVAALMALPIAQLVIGLQNKDNCKINDKIPLYLIISGAFGIAAASIQIIEQMFCRNTDSDESSSRSPCLKFLLQLINLFCICWFICGNVWVYKVHKTVTFDDETSDLYCGKLVYLFSFWTITAVYIIIGATCFIMCCCACLVACFAS